jgi:apolipoprotein N-acyltransferase
MPRYQTHCLVGGSLLSVDGEAHNSACLIAPDGHWTRYDKMLLVPFAETMPGWANIPWFRVQLYFLFKDRRFYRAGENYQALQFQTRRGRTVRLGVSLCYEMFFPWLPQYHDATRANAIVHLTDERTFKDYALFPSHPLWACQYRAIETRSWQLVCTQWTCSAAIDPKGRVRACLPSSPGVLRIGPDTP